MAFELHEQIFSYFFVSYNLLYWSVLYQKVHFKAKEIVLHYWLQSRTERKLHFPPSWIWENTTHLFCAGDVSSYFWWLTFSNIFLCKHTYSVFSLLKSKLCTRNSDYCVPVVLKTSSLPFTSTFQLPSFFLWSIREEQSQYEDPSSEFLFKMGGKINIKHPGKSPCQPQGTPENAEPLRNKLKAGTDSSHSFIKGSSLGSLWCRHFRPSPWIPDAKQTGRLKIPVLPWFRWGDILERAMHFGYCCKFFWEMHCSDTSIIHI